MKKSKTSTGSKVFTIIVAVIVIGLMIGWFIVPNVLSNKLSERLLVDVNIESVGVTPWSVSVNGTKIDNPKGSVLPTALMINKIKVSAPLTRYLSKDIVINEIHLDSIYLDLEFDSAKGVNGNWTELMNNMKKTAPPEEGKKTTPDDERTVLIKRVLFTDMAVDVVYQDNPDKVRRLPIIEEMELTDLSSEGGLPISQILNSVLGEMLTQIFIKQNLQNMIQNVFTPRIPNIPKMIPFLGATQNMEENSAI